MALHVYVSVFEWVMQKAGRFFSLRAPCFQIRKKQKYSVDEWLDEWCSAAALALCSSVVALSLVSIYSTEQPSCWRVKLLGCPLSGYKDSRRRFSGLEDKGSLDSGLGVCVFASKVFGLWQRLLGVIFFCSWVPLA